MLADLRQLACSPALFSRLRLVAFITPFVFSPTRLTCQQQPPADKISINVEVPAPTTKEKGTFDFHVSYSWISGQEPQPISVECTPSSGISCKEKTHVSAHNRYDGVWTATLVGDPNLAEIDASLLDGTGKAVGNETRGVDLGFRQKKGVLGTNLPKTMKAGEEQLLRLWFTDKDNGKLVPTAAVHINLRSDNGCVDFRYVPQDPLPATKSTYIDRGAVTIPADHEQADGFLYLQPHTWFTSICKVDAYETVAGTTELGHDPLEFQVDPAIFPSLIYCLAGVFAQYLASGILQRRRHETEFKAR